LLSRQAHDPEGALQHAQQAVDKIMYDPGRAAEAFFLLGSAHMGLAEQPGETAADEHWREARVQLQEAEQRGLGGDDLLQLRYRLAKAGFHLGDDPARIIEQLNDTLDNADDRAEALTLLTQAYLHLNPPDVKKALETNKKLREVPQVGEDVLGPAKLAGAKLLLELHQRQEARKTLEKIGESSPAATLAEKNMLLAGLYQEENKWAEAAALWRAVREEKRVPLTEAGGVLYNLGVCCRHLDQYAQAGEAWSECIRLSHGEEARAAALALAEVRVQEAHPEKAISLLADAVANVRKADDWKNGLVELTNVRKLFEQAMTVYTKVQRYDLAVQTAELYERIAVPPKAQLRRAELNDAWARSVREHARSLKDKAARKKEETTAEELLRHAAQAHAEAAKLLKKPDKREEQQWLSAVCSYEGHDYARAAEKLKTIVESVKDNIERQSEGWFLLGETCRRLSDVKAAETAYKACAESGAKFTYRARYELAMLAIEAGDIDRAVKLLEQNILIEHGMPDAEAQEKSRLALCALLYQSAAAFSPYYRRVVQYLEGHLDNYALTPESVRARYQLADSYRLLVNQFAVNRVISEKINSEAFDHFLNVSRKSWTRAAEEFTKLEELIQDQEKASLLSVEQQVEIPFRVAECYYNLGEYEKALHKYEDVANKWGNHENALRAMGETIKCYAAMNDPKQLQQRAEKIRGMLTAVEGLSETKRQQWIEWLKIATVAVPIRESDTKSDEPRIIIRPREEPQSREEAGPIIKTEPRR
jgi:tetratricopeptide (TPR) repeat protein